MLSIIAIDVGKKNLFLLKNDSLRVRGWDTRTRRDGDGIPEPVGTEMGFKFLSPLGMGRVTGKYIGIGDGDGEGKTRPHPAPLPWLIFGTCRAGRNC
jgi:hypothetical protein